RDTNFPFMLRVSYKAKERRRGASGTKLADKSEILKEAKIVRFIFSLLERMEAPCPMSHYGVAAPLRK
ncbi:hypothetical protein PAAG_12200, partial [Paracoccidioides lutzii Pb01]